MAKKQLRVRKNRKPKNKKTYTSKVYFKNGFPYNLMARLKYNTEKSFSAAAYYGHEFTVNSLFDPDTTATGHKPAYFNDYSAIYNRYRVLGASMKVQFINTSSVPVRCAIVFTQQQSGVSASSWSGLSRDYVRGPNVRTVVLTLAGGCKDRAVLTLSKLFPKVSNAVPIEDSYSALVTGSPNLTFQMYVVILPLDNSSTITAMADIQLVQYAKFSRKQITDELQED